jgi:branched-chain amino acid transport system substrate-binding protein
MSKRYAWLAVGAILTQLASGCNDDTSDPVDTEYEPVNMGVLLPLTGIGSEFGKTIQKVTWLAVKHLSEAGYDIQIKVADSETEAEAATKAAHHLIENEGVQVLIGGANSAVTIPVAEQVSIPKQVPQISYASTAKEITTLAADEAQDFLFRTTPSVASEGVVLGRLAIESGYRKVSTLYVNDPYGRSLNQVFIEAFQILDGTVNAAIPHESELAASYLAELQQASVEEPEALVAISFSGHVNIYLKEAIDYEIFKNFLFADKFEKLIEILGADALEGMCGTAPGSVFSDSLDIFNQSYEAEYSEKPQTSFLTNTYDAIVVAALAAYSAQASGEALTPLTIREHLRKVAGWPGKQVIAGPDGLKQALAYLRQGLAINYVGASGDVDFDEYGDVVTVIEIWCYEKGEIVTKRLELPCLLCGKK